MPIVVENYSPWLIGFRRDTTTRSRLLCFPYAGASAFAFRPWTAGLPADVELVAVQLPGRDGRVKEPFSESLDEVAEHVATDLAAVDELPFAMFGHSLGALMALAVASARRRLDDVEPTLLIVSGSAGPSVVAKRERLSTLSDDELTKYVADLGHLPAAVAAEPELLNLFLRRIRADIRLRDSYSLRPDEPLCCPVAAWGGEDDGPVGQSDLEAWAPHTRGQFSVRMFPGGHFYIHAHTAELLDALSHAVAGGLTGSGSAKP